MTKQKTVPELEAEKAENERKLSQLQHKKQQIENRITYYEKGDRRKRAHHLITRGAAIESSCCPARKKSVQASSVWNRRSGAWESLIACLSASMRTMWRDASTTNGSP